MQISAEAKPATILVVDDNETMLMGTNSGTATGLLAPASDLVVEGWTGPSTPTCGQ